MARWYDDPGGTPTQEGEGISNLPHRTRKAVLQLWSACVVLVVASVAFYLVADKVPQYGIALPAALLIAVVALACLYVISSSLRAVRLVNRETAESGGKLIKFLVQLDDRFAVFSSIQADSIRADHIIVGPSGVFLVMVSTESPPPATALADARSAAARLRVIAKSLVSDLGLEVEPVICTGSQTLATARQSSGVWVVADRKMVPAILKRSSQEGAITSEVERTGAFNLDPVRAIALEQKLATRWGLVPRKTMKDYAPR